MKIECAAWVASKKNTLCGFATLFLPEIGLQIKDCALHESHGKHWVAFPAIPSRDSYFAVLSIPDDEKRDLFREEAVKAIRAFQEKA